MSFLRPNSQKGFSTIGGYTINNSLFNSYDGLSALHNQLNMLGYSPITQNKILQEAYNKGLMSDALASRANNDFSYSIKLKDSDIMSQFLNSGNLSSDEIDYLKASTSAQEANRALGITNGVFQGLGALTNAGLDIWQAIESNKNLKKQRDVADKQIALAEEQIQASKQYRQERADEIARLNRVRSNTSKAFNTGSVITRSY